MNCHAKVVPAILNSGEFWGKGMLIKRRGIIKIKFLDPIDVGLTKAEFMRILEDRMEKSKL